MTDMNTYLTLKMSHADPLPGLFRDDDVRYPDALVEYFVREFTKPGDVVLDPFAGFGTTLKVAERLDRVAYGVELEPMRAAWVREGLRHPENLIQGDARSLRVLNIPPVDLVMTSPPYMNRGDTEDPLSAYQMDGQGYEAYLLGLAEVFRQVRDLLKTEGRLVIEVANLKSGGVVTTLAWDIGRLVAESMKFEGEVVVCWDRYGYGYDHSYCLVYSLAQGIAQERG